MIDPVKISIDLINLKTITPNDNGAMELIIKILEPYGFKSTIKQFNKTRNLYIKFGTQGRNLCFLGHTDVVSEGDAAKWRFDPFKATIHDDILYGRGAVDMKGAIAAFIAAVVKFVPICNESISILLTSDEEGVGADGTIKMLKELETIDEKIDYSIVGEPTNPEFIGEMIKIGRRGSISFKLIVIGKQGHVAYPELADNPVTQIIKIAEKLVNLKLDEGNEFFAPSNLEVTSIDVGNSTTNLIPHSATANFNIRFNDLHDSYSLTDKIRDICNQISSKFELEIISSSESFILKPDNFALKAREIVSKLTGIDTIFSTTGGTSDARFMRNYAPVFEFGLINASAHQINESVKIADIYLLSDIYLELLKSYFKR
jgi:succinyl-diaminopimelate desuccinylase